jgi:hypothetical protein
MKSLLILGVLFHDHVMCSLTLGPLNDNIVSTLTATLGLADLRAKYQAKTLRLGLLMQAAHSG